MASSLARGPFLNYWGNYCKDTFGEAMGLVDLDVKFSEGLLHSLYYETDVGSIPRGIQFDTSASKPQFVDSNNWNCSIQGCYWCGDDSTDLLGICCSKDCIFYLHDWCIERVKFFTKRQFCRLPGCDNLHGLNSLYCSSAHRGKFDAAFPQFVDHKKLRQSVIRSGSYWYNSQTLSNSCTVNQSVVPPNSDYSSQLHYTPKTLPARYIGKSDRSVRGPNYNFDIHSQNDRETSWRPRPQRLIKTTKNHNTCSFEFPDQFRDMLIYDTDVGVIPRGRINQQSLSSKFYDSPNWSAVIKGCYSCGNRNVGKFYNEMFCTERCQLVFYEWCRKKIERETSTTFCQLPGCPKYASDGFDCCNKEHSIIIQQKYTDCNNMDIKRLICTTPSWYNRSLTPFESIPPTNQHSQVKTSHQTFPNPGVNPTTALSSVVSGELPKRVVSSQSRTSPLNPPTNPATKLNRFRFSAKLSAFLSQYIDTKTVPRSHGEESSPSDHFPCRKEDIIGCYWCESNDTCFEEMACSARCWFLLHEWCVRRVEQVCALPGCEKPRVDACHCCSLEHIKNLSLMRGSVVFLSQEEMELTLGPKWYTDFTPVHFSASGPFSELSNSFPSLLILNHMIWPTVRHYMCAQKLLGTPYVHHMSKAERLTDLDEWGVCSDGWARPDWEGVRKRVLYQALMAKFQQNCVLKGLLLRTRSRPLVCRDDACLGEMLMSVREVVKAFRLFPNINLNSSGDLSTEVSFGHLEQVNASHSFESFERTTNNPVSDYLEDPHHPTDVPHDKEQLFS